MAPFLGSLVNGNLQLDLELFRTYEATCVNEKYKIKFMGAEDSSASLIQRPMLAINKCFGQHCKTDEETK